MNININEEDGKKIINLSGDIDLSCSADIRDKLLAQLNDNNELIVDMSAVNYIDSSGVASLVEAYQTARKSDKNFALLSVSNAAMSVLQLARLDKVFPIFDNLECYEK